MLVLLDLSIINDNSNLSQLWRMAVPLWMFAREDEKGLSCSQSLTSFTASEAASEISYNDVFRPPLVAQCLAVSILVC